MIEPLTIKGDGITLDLLLWRRFGRAGQAMTEAVLVLNRGLSRLGAEIPVGTVVFLPEAPPPARIAPQPVSLFD